MDSPNTASDFQDWDLLQPSSDSDSSPVSFPDSGESFNEIDSVSLIQVNYFSLDPHTRHGEDLDDDKSAGSDNPSWIDPGSEENRPRFLAHESGEFWSDSGSDRSEYRKSGVFCEKQEVGVEGIGEIFEEKDMGSSGMVISSPKHGGLPEKMEVLGEENNEDKRIEKVGDCGRKDIGGLRKRNVQWWKMPVEVLKYCMFRMSPVSAVSVAAAALMGFAILGHRLYKMKKKTRGLEIKVAIDDKKASQVMSRAARLNEAFSIVKRVPVIRPSLPAVGSPNTWPVIGLR